MTEWDLKILKAYGSLGRLLAEFEACCEEIKKNIIFSLIANGCSLGIWAGFLRINMGQNARLATGARKHGAGSELYGPFAARMAATEPPWMGSRRVRKVRCLPRACAEMACGRSRTSTR